MSIMHMSLYMHTYMYMHVHAHGLAQGEEKGVRFVSMRMQI